MTSEDMWVIGAIVTAASVAIAWMLRAATDEITAQVIESCTAVAGG